MKTYSCLLSLSVFVLSGSFALQQTVAQDQKQNEDNSKGKVNSIVAKPGLFDPLTEPPCSYCVDQNLKGLIKQDDIVLAWIRGAHNGGAFPLRHFISGQRVINDTYGLFFYDPDGGYVAAYKKDYGFTFYGWRGGVMVVKGPDGTLWSALSGRAIQGPQSGKRLTRVPSMVTTWSHWLLLHPESTAYDLFDGKKYKTSDLPSKMSDLAKSSMQNVDKRLESLNEVLGVEGEKSQVAFSLVSLPERAVRQIKFENRDIAIFYYGKTKTAVAFDATVDGQTLHFYADKISPATAPFKDKETGTRWTLAGRAVDGPLRGKELKWVNSIKCRWYAWSFEYPQTELVKSNEQ